MKTIGIVIVILEHLDMDLLENIDIDIPIWTFLHLAISMSVREFDKWLISIKYRCEMIKKNFWFGFLNLQLFGSWREKWYFSSRHPVMGLRRVLLEPEISLDERAPGWWGSYVGTAPSSSLTHIYRSMYQERKKQNVRITLLC